MLPICHKFDLAGSNYLYKFEPVNINESYEFKIEQSIANEPLKFEFEDVMAFKIEEMTMMKNPPYTGDYIVTPKMFRETILQTKDKTMTNNVVVKKIPYYEIENQSGGTTVYIAMEDIQ